MCGLPYPNPADPELAARMAFLDSQQQRPGQQAAAPRRGSPAAAAAARQRSTASSLGAAASSSPGRQHYEDLCMKAVNQCVGRVIRTRTDWAAIVLADVRWSAPAGSHRHALPAWIQQALRPAGLSFEQAMTQLQAFMRAHS